MKKIKNFTFALLLLLITFTGCSEQVHYPTRNIFALKHDSLTSELIVFTTPNFNQQSVVLFGVTSYNISPDNQKIVYSTVSYGYEQLAIIPKEGEEYLLTTGNQFFRFPNISPDGKLVLVEKRDVLTGEPQIMILDTDTIVLAAPVEGDSSGILPVWSNNGHFVSYLSRSDYCNNNELSHCYDLLIVSFDSKAIVAKIPGPISDTYPISWSEDSTEIVFSRLVNSHYDLVIFDLYDQKEHAIDTDGQDNINSILSYNGEQVVYKKTSLEMQKSKVCVFMNSIISCSNADFTTITGMLWVDGQTILFGTYDATNDETSIKLMDTRTMVVVDMGKYTGYIDSFMTLRK